MSDKEVFLFQIKKFELEDFDFDTKEKVGCGGFGKIYKVPYKDDSGTTVVAIKKPNKKLNIERNAEEVRAVVTLTES